MNKEKRTAIYTALRERMPAPTTELNHQDPFELLISVVLSAQATDISVNKATAKLYPVARTPKAILALGVNGLTPYIRTIGLFNTKARNIIATCRILIELHARRTARTWKTALPDGLTPAAMGWRRSGARRDPTPGIPLRPRAAVRSSAARCTCRTATMDRPALRTARGTGATS